MPTFNDARIRYANSAAVRREGQYVLYWMQGFRRFDRNHALDYALFQSVKLNKPLVVYEGLRIDYPWASDRTHRFMLEGMLDNARTAEQVGITYWPYVETPDQPAKGLLQKIAEKACLIVTDDYPAFVVPGQIAGLANRTNTAVHAVDSNSIVPLKLLGTAVSAAAHIRPRIHKLFGDAWGHRATAEPDFSRASKTKLEPPFRTWKLADRPEKTTPADLDKFISALPIDHSVKSIPLIGGSSAAHDVMDSFVKSKLKFYAEGRNAPDDPAETAASGLSAHLRHGHISIQEIAEKVLNHFGEWTPEMIDMKCKGKREGFYRPNANVNSFLDEAITWRDVGYHWHYCRLDKIRLRNADSRAAKELHWEPPIYQDLESTLPTWAYQSLQKHADDPRTHLYTLEQWEAADTHDDLWNAAQIELMKTGRIHNYLRMLWGKKVLEWSKSPDEAYFILEHLNNKYAIDGRDPNSYTGLLWCFGLFDRPWPPERPVFGNIRYMSSDNTAKKFKLDGYYRYIYRLQKEENT